MEKAGVLPTVFWVYQHSLDIIPHLPDTGDRDKNYKWMKVKKDKWNNFVAENENEFSDILLLSIPLFISNDLLEVIKLKSTLEMIQPIFDSCITIHKAIDSEGRSFDKYEKADFLINELYNITGFRR